MFAVRRRLPTCLLFLVLATAVVLSFVLVLRFSSTANRYELPRTPATTTSRTMLERSTSPAANSTGKRVYPRRKNMDECRPLFGRVGVFVAVSADHHERLYKIAQASLKCYLKSTNYSFFYVDIHRDERTRGLCSQSNIFYKRHCVGAYYLQEVDWMLFLDADIGVVNPAHCIEEWIDDRVDMLFYERFFNWEIMAGSYLMRNTEQSRRFLLEWAAMESRQFRGFTGYDNGALQLQILKTALPNAVAEIKACDAIYHRAKTLEQYYDYVTCCKLQLGATRVFAGRLRVYRRAHGWARDSSLTANRWSSADFMMHSWKASELNATLFDANVFEEIPAPAECGRGLSGWRWRPEKRATVHEIRAELAAFEAGVAAGYPKEARDLPHLVEPDVRECYPDCDRLT